MRKAIRAHNLGASLAMALVAVLFVVAVAFAVHQVATTSEPDVHATSAEGSGITKDPYIERHAEVVDYYSNRVGISGRGEDSATKSSLVRDPAIERHAEVVAHFNQDGSRR